IAGAGPRTGDEPFVKYVFVLLQPDILFILIGVSLLSRRLFFINAVIFLVSMAIRGWMGGFFIVFIMVFARYSPVRISLYNMFFLLLFLVLFVLMLPAIIDMKWSMRQGVSFGDFFSNVSSSFSVDSYGLVVSYLLNR